jgi:hypothetical protein
MLNVDEFPIAISQDQKIKEEAIKHLTAQLKEWRSKIIECEKLISQQRNELLEIDIENNLRRSQGKSQDAIYENSFDKKSFFQKFILRIYNLFHYIYKSFRKKNTVYIDFKKYPIDSRYLDRIDSIRQLDSDISKTQILNNSIAEINIKINYYAFKFVLNYQNYHRRGGQITAGFLTEVGHNFARAIEFLEFFNNPENLSSNYLISHDELSKFISSYRLFYDISPELNYGIVSEEFTKVNSLYLKSIELVKENNELHKNFGDFNKLVEEYRVNENSILSISKKNISLFLEIKKQIHDRLDIGLPIAVNELQTLKNYIFLHNKLSDLKKINYDISINKVAERIRSLQPSNQAENSNHSLISRKNIPSVSLSSSANDLESFSYSNPQLNAKDSPTDVPGVSVRQMVEKYNTISSPEIVKKIDKLRESKALGENGVTRVLGKKNDGSFNLGVGKVFVTKLERKSDEGKEVLV